MINSISNHLTHPFSVQQNNKVIPLQAMQMIHTVALAALAGIAATLLFNAAIGLVMGVTVFYIASDYEKMRVQSLFPKIAPQSTPTPARSPFINTLKPILDHFIAKAIDPNLCFIKSKTGPFLEWFQTEYRSTNIQAKNIERLRTSHPDIDQGLFVDIRGDGECTYRSIGTGLWLQACCAEPKPAFQQLLEQFDRIVSQLSVDVENIDHKIVSMEMHATSLRKQAKQSETVLEQHPEQYRLQNGNFNEQGLEIHTSIGEINDLAAIFENHILSLKHPDNRNKIQQVIAKLKNDAAQIRTHMTSATPKQELMLKLQDPRFDELTMRFLRRASALNIGLNLVHMGRYAKQFGQEQLIARGELTLLDLLLRKAEAYQPNMMDYMGSVNDVQSLSLLFEQPMSYYKVEDRYEPKDHSVHTFGPEQHNHKNKIFVLNRTGHSDLIFV